MVFLLIKIFSGGVLRSHKNQELVDNTLIVIKHLEQSPEHYDGTFIDRKDSVA